jgi:hypothetical protein
VHYDRSAIPMLRARLLTSLVFNLCTAIWVLADARARGARKPVFAALLALMWGPLGLGFWEADRPLAAGETRSGGAAAFARGFLRAWVAMLPAVAVLVHAAVEHRAAVPGSLGRDIGLLPATGVVLSMAWAVPALLAVVLGRLARTGQVERGTSAAAAFPMPATMAAVIAGAAALAAAVVLTR